MTVVFLLQYKRVRPLYYWASGTSAPRYVKGSAHYEIILWKTEERPIVLAYSCLTIPALAIDLSRGLIYTHVHSILGS